MNEHRGFEHSALYGRLIFEEDCRAWVHGSVYPEVYELFRDFRKGYGDSIPSSELLPKERIMKYYVAINCKYGIGTEEFYP